MVAHIARFLPFLRRYISVEGHYGFALRDLGRPVTMSSGGLYRQLSPRRPARQGSAADVLEHVVIRTPILCREGRPLRARK
jgi:hypothetical protein